MIASSPVVESTVVISPVLRYFYLFAENFNGVLTENSERMLHRKL